MSSTGYTECMKGYERDQTSTDEFDCAPIVLKQCSGNKYRNSDNKCVSCADGCTLNDLSKICECQDTVKKVEEACDSTCK